MTPEQQTKLAHVKALLTRHIEEAEKAMAGPWQPFQHASGSRGIGSYQTTVCGWQKDCCPTCDERYQNNATFIASARTLSPLACKALLLALDELEAVADGDCDPNGYAKDRLEEIANLFADYPHE